MPNAAFTDGPVAVTLPASQSKLIVPANMFRVGLLICNATSSNVFLAFGGVDPTASRYGWHLAPNEDWAVPSYGAVQEVRAFSVLALGTGLCYSEFVAT